VATTTTDEETFSRALAFERRARLGVVQRAEPHRVGEAFFHTERPRVHDANLLTVDVGVDADELMAALDELYVGYPHRKAVIERDDVGRRLARPFAERGWTVQRHVYMALRRRRDREPVPDLARETDAATLRPLQDAATREEPFGCDEQVVQQLSAHAEAWCTAVPAVRYFVAADDGIDAAVTTLYSDGVIAQVEDVATLSAHRCHGLARATVSMAVDAALATGHELIFLVADDQDWPKALYANLGFDPVGLVWPLVRPGPEGRWGAPVTQGIDSMRRPPA